MPLNPRIRKLSTELTEMPGTGLGLSVEQARFCEYIAAGLTATEAYRRAMATKASQASVRVSAARWMKLADIQNRIKQLTENPDAKKEQLLDPEWLRIQVLNGLYLLGTGAVNERVRLEAWKALGETKPVDLFVQANTGININNTMQQAIAGANADELRTNLIKELKSFSNLALPEPEEVIALDPLGSYGETARITGSREQSEDASREDADGIVSDV